MKQEINGKKSTSPLSNANPDCSSSSPEHHSQHGPCVQPRLHNQGGSQVPNTHDSEPEYFSNNFWREPIIELTPTVIDQQLSGKSGNKETIGAKDVVEEKSAEKSLDEIVAEKVKFYLKDLDPEEEEKRFFTEVEEVVVEKKEEGDLMEQLQRFLKQEEEHGVQIKAPLTVRTCCLFVDYHHHSDTSSFKNIFKNRNVNLG